MTAWQWQVELDPPEPQGVLGYGVSARNLWHAADARLQREAVAWMIGANDDVLVLTGSAQSLPWADGVQYIAPRLEAPALWFPTTMRPTVPLDLLARALNRIHPVQPVLLLPSPTQLFPLSNQLPASPDILQKIRNRWLAG